jgi:hypothetical protein
MASSIEDSRHVCSLTRRATCTTCSLFVKCTMVFFNITAYVSMCGCVLMMWRTSVLSYSCQLSDCFKEMLCALHTATRIVYLLSHGSARAVGRTSDLSRLLLHHCATTSTSSRRLVPCVRLCALVKWLRLLFDKLNHTVRTRGSATSTYAIHLVYRKQRHAAANIYIYIYMYTVCMYCKEYKHAQTCTHPSHAVLVVAAFRQSWSSASSLPTSFSTFANACSDIACERTLTMVCTAQTVVCSGCLKSP